jgi:hypothetical protein
MAADPWNARAQIPQTPAQARDSPGQCAERNLGEEGCVNFSPGDAAQKTAAHSLRQILKQHRENILCPDGTRVCTVVILPTVR